MEKEKKKKSTEEPKTEKKKTYFGEDKKANPKYPDLQDTLDYLYEEAKKDGFL